MTLATPLYIPSKRGLHPEDPPNDLDKASLKNTMKGIATVMNSEWLEEGEASSEIIQIYTPSTIPCFIEGTAVTVLYNPMVGVNIISASFALDHSGERIISPTTNPKELDHVLV